MVLSHFISHPSQLHLSPLFCVNHSIVALLIHYLDHLHQQPVIQANIFFCASLNTKEHALMGFEMMFQGFQPSDEQIEDLERGRPINEAQVERDAEQQQEQHQQQQQQRNARTLPPLCTQHSHDDEDEHKGDDEVKGEDEDSNEDPKQSPDTQEGSHAGNGSASLSSNDAQDSTTDAIEENISVPEGPQDAAMNPSAADSAPTANERDSAASNDADDPEEINVADYSIYTIMATNILFPMPNNPTYEQFYADLQDHIPDSQQREQALQLLHEITIVMFSEAGDLQSNVESKDADAIWGQPARLELLQTMASYIKETHNQNVHLRLHRGGGGGGGDDGDDGDGWHLDSDDEDSEDEADRDPEFQSNLKKSLAEQKQIRLQRQRHYQTWRCYTITLEFFITFLLMQRSKLREIHLTLRNECRTKSQVLDKMRRNEQSKEVNWQMYNTTDHC